MLAPEAVKVALWPEHTTALPPIKITGTVLTTTGATVLVWHPLMFVPVAVYDVVLNGDTLILLPVIPVFQV